MGFEIVGFEEEIDSLVELTGEHTVDDHPIPITFEGLFPRAFMQLYTDVGTFAEFMENSPWTVKSMEEFEAIPEQQFDGYLDAHTKFPSWEEMLKSAGAHFFERVQYQ
jgi:hypothetical protein